MQKKIFSESSWMVFGLLGMAVAASFYFYTLEGPLAVNLGLVEPQSESNYARASAARGVPQNAVGRANAAQAALEKGFGPFAYGEYEIPPDGEGVFSGEFIHIIDEIFTEDGKEVSAENNYYIHDMVTGIVVKVKPDGKLPPGLEGGAFVRAKGNVKKGELSITANAGGGSGSVEVLEPASVFEEANAATTRSVIAITSNVTDRQIECSNSQVNNILFGDTNSVRGGLESASHGAISITGVVEGPFDIPHVNSDSYSVKYQSLKSAALAAGVNVSAYDHVVWVFPHNGHWGTGQINGSNTWVSKCNVGDIYQHELGHNFGLGHSAVGTNQYADQSSFMGYSNVGVRHTHAFNMDYENWLPESKILRNPGSGTYTVYSSDALPSSFAGPQAIQFGVEGSASAGFYLSYRTPTGYANNMPSGYDNQGQLHYVPNMNAYTQTELRQRFTNGVSWSDSTSGLTITQVSSVPGESATFEVTTQCIANAPTVTVSPSNQSAAPGDTKQYTVSVKNNNTSGCGAGSITLSGSVGSAGLTTSLSQSSVNLAPGASTNVTLSASSDSTIAGGSHTITISANSGSSAGSVTATYTIDNQAPSTPSNLSGSSKRKQVNLTWNSSSDNVGVTGYEVLRNGQVIGTTGNTSFADRNAGGGDNVYQVRAFDGARNMSGLSNSTTVNFKGGSASTDGGDTGGGGNSKCSPWPSCR